MTRSSYVGKGALLTDEQRRALTAELTKEFWRHVHGQCQSRQWPGKLQAWDVSPEGRVLEGVQTHLALVWMDAGPQPAVCPRDPRVMALLANRQARQEVRNATSALGHRKAGANR